MKADGAKGANVDVLQRMMLMKAHFKPFFLVEEDDDHKMAKWKCI
jgi:hypothetical protein